MKLFTLYHKVLSQVEAFFNLTQQKPKAGRKPKISDQQIITLFILSCLTHSPVLTLAKLLIDPSINSYHIFRRARQKRIYSYLRQFMLWKVRMMLTLKFLSGKKLKLIVDGKRVKFEELYYGVLVMVLCDEDGVVYDIWFTYGSMHEAKAYRIRKAKSAWFRNLVEGAEVYGDRGYKGVEGVIVFKSKEDKSIRQVVEGVISCVKSFNPISRWREAITLLAYLYGYAIAYSFFRGQLRCYG
ncbi:MAG: hypothetical protein N2648_05250 [Aquificaceae bacterium]|nr:hypothetical protein [Aquificaceae bacterium]